MSEVRTTGTEEELQLHFPTTSRSTDHINEHGDVRALDAGPPSLHRNKCPLCKSDRIHYAFIAAGHPVCRCPDCGFVFLNPQPSDEVLAAIYSSTYFLMGDSPEGKDLRLQMKTDTARQYLKEITNYLGASTGRLLELGCGDGEFLAEARRTGFNVHGLDISASAVEQANRRLGEERVLCGTLDCAEIADGSYDVCVFADVIEHVRDPVDFLCRVHRLLKDGGVLFLVTPSLDSWSARLMRGQWMEFKPEHLHYFNSQTIQNALVKAGFDELYVCPTVKCVSFEYVYQHFRNYRVPFWTRLVSVARAIMPRRLRNRRMKMSASGINVVARKRPRRDNPVLSIIVPAYNEKDTFEELMQALLAKEIPGLDKEVIIVESNSTDGTREIALSYRESPGVKVLLEERPRGKGHAVRTGFANATGDFVLIQDADLEYDLNDYDELLEPLIRYQRAFVLGSRHKRGWKMRQFSDSPMTAVCMNLGHVFFATLLNLFCGRWLRDPFTMYKVFRRDCLFNLTFVSNRFDLDWELVIKFLRKGYKPLEIPVNYRSRSFKEGKKVSFLKDPPQWLWRLVRSRFGQLYNRRYERQ